RNAVERSLAHNAWLFLQRADVHFYRIEIGRREVGRLPVGVFQHRDVIRGQLRVDLPLASDDGDERREVVRTEASQLQPAFRVRGVRGSDGDREVEAYVDWSFPVASQAARYSAVADGDRHFGWKDDRRAAQELARHRALMIRSHRPEVESSLTRTQQRGV